MQDSKLRSTNSVFMSGGEKLLIGSNFDRFGDSMPIWEKLTVTNWKDLSFNECGSLSTNQKTVDSFKVKDGTPKAGPPIYATEEAGKKKKR